MNDPLFSSGAHTPKSIFRLRCGCEHGGPGSVFAFSCLVPYAFRFRSFRFFSFYFYIIFSVLFSFLSRGLCCVFHQPARAGRDSRKRITSDWPTAGRIEKRDQELLLPLLLLLFFSRRRDARFFSDSISLSTRWARQQGSLVWKLLGGLLPTGSLPPIVRRPRSQQQQHEEVSSFCRAPRRRKRRKKEGKMLLFRC